MPFQNMEMQLNFKAYENNDAENMFKCHSHNRALTLPCLSNSPVLS